ncbi:MAG: flagellar filament capping protein FliD [Planctomycetaceae bacterium]|jgi:flagellar hook-associated protein 2|nr:flagellar filament capping protein FliD [Planctomycetaceae bacterium]
MAIQSSIGLISGIDYTSLVNQLIEIDRIPQTNLQTRNDTLIKEESALVGLEGLFSLAVYTIGLLAKTTASESLFKSVYVNSSNETLLRASRNGSPAVGSYTFTPIRTATAQQSIASGVSSSTTALNKTGEIVIGKSWTLENDINLSDLNGGDGFIKGYIRITDGSGTRSTIDLRTCVTMNDVLDKINSNVDIDVMAELDGNKLVLTDLSGESPDKIKVQEVSGGRTAASLGLVGSGATTDAVEGTITGSSVYYLGRNMQVGTLNDGMGLSFSSILSDLQITTKDGSEITIDFNKRTTEGGESKSIKELTLGDVLDTINNAENNNGKIIASIGGADGKSLVITDTTGINYVEAKETTESDGTITYSLPDAYDANDYELDSDNYVVDKATSSRVVDPTSTGKTKIVQVTNNNVPVLKSLGLIDGLWDSSKPVEFDGSITTRSLLGDLDSSLMSTLNGGYGFSNSNAGKIEVQDRLGNTTELSFDADEMKQMQSGSIKNVMKILNEKLATAGIGIEVTMNESKTGLMLMDTTTGTKTHNMIFRDLSENVTYTDEDGNPATREVDPNIAKALGLDVDQASSIVVGKSLNKQTVSFNTLLSDLNGGRGVKVANGQISIKDSAGQTSNIIINSATATTVGDIINAINDSARNSGSPARVLARLNSTGDGIEILDLGGGSGTFSISDGSSTSTICAELGISQTLSATDADPVTGRMSINGRQSKVIQVEETDTLETIRDKINQAGGNFNASIVSDGSGLPYRLMINGASTGTVSGMNIDLSAIGLSVENMVEASNAVLVYGDPNSLSAITLQSKNNTFEKAVDGIDLTVLGRSSEPITIDAENAGVDVKAALKSFVENYNTFREQLTTNTYYYYDDTTKLGGGGDLANNAVARQMDIAITKALSKTVTGIPGIFSLIDLGIEITANTDKSGNYIPTNKDTNKLTFDEATFDKVWATNKEGVEKFFVNPQTAPDPSGGIDPDTGEPKTVTVSRGWAQNFMDMVDTITGDNGTITRRLEALGKTIDTNEQRVAFLEERLEFKRQTMLKKFYAMEQAMAKMSSSLESVNQISTTWASNSTVSSS